MKIIFMSILLLMLSSSILGADNSYIRITSTKSKSTLIAIKHKLQSMGLPMMFKTTTRSYNVYSGPYKTLKHSRYALKKIKRYFPKAIVIQTTTKPEKKQIKSQLLHTKKEKKTKTNIIFDYKFYTTIALAYSSAPSSHTIETGTVNVITPNNKGINISLEGGVDLKHNFNTGIGYMHVGTTDLVFNNIYGVLNYEFKSFSHFTPYFGVLVGYSALS